ncbi:tetratricopeptide repeat protein [Candidatus Lokiarchaeum ossiferum]|uniref:tetratricopeptide repeat protein n=1 Tax=Candidatus Lokiarchaeum ossiferum TaxID=2951803 RepID=UPI00352CC3E2
MEKKSEIDIQKAIQEGIIELKKTYEKEENIKVIEERATIASSLGVLLWKDNQSQDAKKYFLLALGEYEKLNDDFKIATTQGTLGSLFLELGEYALSQKYNEDAYEYWKGTNFLNERIACLQNLGIILLRNQDELKASEYILEGLRMAISLQDENQFAITIQILLEHYEKLKRFDMLLELKKKALEFWTQMDLPQRKFKTLIDLGVISQLMEDFSAAITFFKPAFNIGYHAGDLEKMFLAEGFLAETYLKLRETEKAKNTYLQAFKLAVYINVEKDYKQHVEAMRLALLSLGYTIEELVKEGQKALEEAQFDQNQ